MPEPTGQIPHAAPAPHGISRILIVRPSALGDVCRTVPVLASLAQGFPRARIDWLVQDTFQDAISAHPALHRAVIFPRSDFSPLIDPRNAAAAVRWLGSLGKDRYDLVLDCQGLARSGVIARATRAPVRVGYRNAAEFGWLGVNRRVFVPASLHAVDRMLALVAHAGAPVVRDMRLYVPPAGAAAIAQGPRFAPLRESRYAVIAPTSRWPGKRWPAERFAALAAALLDEPGARLDRVAVVGGASEHDQCGPIAALAARDPRIVNLVGVTTVASLMALIAGASLAVANDSAALHMAVGLGTPVVGLFGPTDAARVGPYQQAQWVLRRAEPGDHLGHKNAHAGRLMMERISVGDALRLALSALEVPAPRQAGTPAPACTA